MAAFLFALAWRRSAVGQRTNPLPLTRTLLRAALSPDRS